MPLKTGGQLIAQWMDERQIPYFFHVPGETFLTVLDALYDTPSVRVITCRHESGASFGAEAYAKVTGKPAVCMGSRGPGASNLSIGIQTALYDGTPMVVLIGQVPVAGTDSGAFQEVDMGALFAPICKRVFRVASLETLPAVLRQAEAMAMAPRPGPVVIAIPTDLLGNAVEIGTLPSAGAVDTRGFWDVEPLMALLASAERPLILMATEARRADLAHRVARFAAAVGIPVSNAWRRFSAFPNDHANFVGNIGLGATRETVAVLEQADLILGLGYASEYVTLSGGSRLAPNSRFVQIAAAVHPDALRRSGQATVEFVPVDPAIFMRSLETWQQSHPETVKALHQRHWSRTRALRETYERQFAGEVQPTSGRVHMDYLMKRLDQILPANAVLVSDAGNFAQWLLRFVQFGQDRVFLAPTNGAMGYGLPGGVGASLAMPDRPVWSVAGDGGLLMTVGEMETAAREGLNLVVVAVNNARYGTIQANQEKEFPGRTIGTELTEIDFHAMAQAMNWQAWRVSHDKELDDALSRILAERGCRLLEVMADRQLLALSMRDFVGGNL